MTVLLDLENVESFCSRILATAVNGFGGYLDADSFEEAHDWLVCTAVELAVAYRPNDIYSFEWYASQVLRRRVVDWYRRELGDSRAKQKRPARTSLHDWADVVDLPHALTVLSHENEVLDRVAVG